MNAVGTAVGSPQLPAGGANGMQDMFRLSMRSQQTHSANIHGIWMPFILRQYREAREALGELADTLPQLGESWNSKSLHSSPRANRGELLAKWRETVNQGSGAVSVSSRERIRILASINAMEVNLKNCSDELQDVRQMLPNPNKTMLDGDQDLDQLLPLLGQDLYDEWLAATRVLVSAEALMEAAMESWQHNIECRSQIIQRIKECIASVSS